MCGALALLGVIDGATVHRAAMSGHDLMMGEINDGSTTPVTSDDTQVLSAPVQVPAIVPTQGSRLLTPAKYRTTLMRANILRRSAVRLSDNVYAPLALSGQFVVERMSSPLPHRAVYYHVITLCRLLC